MNVRTGVSVWPIVAAAIAVLISGCSPTRTTSSSVTFIPGVSVPEKLDALFENAHVIHYDGSAGIGINHIAYWGMSSEDVALLPPKEQIKVARLQPNNISSTLFSPDVYDPISGYEVTGILTAGESENTRVQTVSLVIPDHWNGNLVVFGTSGVRNEYGTASLLSPWLLKKGYATIGGDKGLRNGAADLYAGKHITRHWGRLMIDLAIAGMQTIKASTGVDPKQVYTVGVSNGGLQSRLALEIDHARVKDGQERIFDGGLTWSAVYFPRAEIMDGNQDGEVTPVEYAEKSNYTLIGTHICAALTMGWFYDENSAANTIAFNLRPAFSSVYDKMVSECGFHSDSAPIWGVYSAFFDRLKDNEGRRHLAGLGYFNRVPQSFLAEFRGDNEFQSRKYSPRNIGVVGQPIKPTFYSFMDKNKRTLGFTEEAVEHMLEISNTAEFSVPLIEIQGTKDGIISLKGQAYAYRDAVSQFGNPDLHRLYLIKDGMHIETHADPGTHIDFDLNGVANDVNIADEMTPVQGYAEIAMDKLEAWVENGITPVKGGLVATDTKNDKVIPF
ncbi:MAG: hypothetical protein K6L76_05770 [Agarilytica sp.]